MAFLTWSGNLPSGFVFNWGDGNITLTHSANTLTMAGGAFGIGINPSTVYSGYLFVVHKATNNNFAVDVDSEVGTGIALVAINDINSQGIPLQLRALQLFFTDSATGDEFLRFDTLGTAQFGSNAAVPSVQTVTGPSARAGTDTNAVGGRINWRTGLSTGNAVPAIQSLQGGAATVTSGTGAQIVVDRFIPNAFKVLTNNVATAVVNVTVANNTVAGGVLDYVIECTDGTDVQVESGRAVFSTGNKAGVIAGTITEVNSQQNATGASTLATTWAISNANPAVISINANSSLVPSTGYPRITFSIKNLGQQAVAIQ